MITLLSVGEGERGLLRDLRQTLKVSRLSRLRVSNWSLLVRVSSNLMLSNVSWGGLMSGLLGMNMLYWNVMRLWGCNLSSYVMSLSNFMSNLIMMRMSGWGSMSILLLGLLLE